MAAVAYEKPTVADGQTPLADVRAPLAWARPSVATLRLTSATLWPPLAILGLTVAVRLPRVASPIPAATSVNSNSQTGIPIREFAHLSLATPDPSLATRGLRLAARKTPLARLRQRSAA